MVCEACDPAWRATVGTARRLGQLSVSEVVCMSVRSPLHVPDRLTCPTTTAPAGTAAWPCNGSVVARMHTGS
jgi:hypothetical protein